MATDFFKNIDLYSFIIRISQLMTNFKIKSDAIKSVPKQEEEQLLLELNNIKNMILTIINQTIPQCCLNTKDNDPFKWYFTFGNTSAKFETSFICQMENAREKLAKKSS